MKKKIKTEILILEAAKRVFIRKGLDGARMQEIADEAGINKSLVHYYYRNKATLFEAVFSEAFQAFIPRISEAMSSDIPFEEKIGIFTGTYMNMLMENPHIPAFILHEIHRNPGNILSLMQSQGVNPELMFRQVRKAVKDKTILPVDPRQLFVNMVAMCIFPIVAKPILQGLIFGSSEKAYSKFLEERKREVPEFIISAIRKK